jgi:hypothetical protein
MTRAQGGWTALLVAAVLMVGCSSSSSDDSDGMSVSEDSADESSEGGLGGGEGGGFGGADDAGGDTGGADGDAAGAEESAAPAGREVDTVALAQAREVIRTGDLRLEVDAVGDAVADVRRIAGAAGGFVSNEEALSDARTASVTVRVPSGDFDSVRGDIAALGEVVEQTVQAEDVTAEMVDVETRIESLRRSVARLQEMLGGSGDVAQLSAVEGELARREVELEAMLGQQRLLEDQVALGTLTVHLAEDAAAPTPDDDAAGFRDGLRQGWVTLVDVARVLVAVLGFLLPWLVPTLVIAVLVRWFLQRRSPSPTAPPPPAPAET